MTVVALSYLPVQAFLSNNGLPLVGGQLFSYQAGTSTPAPTYTDSTGSVSLPNPIILNARGEVATSTGTSSGLWIPPNTAYKFVLEDVLGNTIWTIDQVFAPIGNLSTALTQTILGPILFPQTSQEISASVTPANYIFPPLQDLGTLARYGADPTGVADSQPALLKASNVGVPFQITNGTYLVNSNITIVPNVVFLPGAILKPAAGVTITLSSSLQAGIYQIFDLTLGGLVTLPRSTSEVWAEWWGAKGDNTKTNNEVPFNQAWFALAQIPPGSGYGGVIRFARGNFLHSGTIFSSDNISHRGDDFFYSLLLANSATWNSAHNSSITSQSSTLIQFTAPLAPSATSATLSATWAGSTNSYPVLFFETAGGACPIRTVTLTNGLTTATWSGGLTNACTVNAGVFGYQALFNNRIENCRIHVAAITAITQAVYAPAWQQKCGTDNVFIFGCTKYGILMDNGYGGAAQLTLRRTEVFHDPSCATLSYGIYANFTNITVGWIDIDLQEVQTASSQATVTFTGALVAATSATLTGNWIYPSGSWNVAFSDGSYRLVTLTNGATTATWSGAVTASANATGISPNSNGISGNGRVILNAHDTHAEQQASHYVLQGACQLTGEGITADSNPTVQNVVTCAGSWTGNINVKGMMRGGAPTFILDNSRGPYALANAQGASGYPGGVGGGDFGNETRWPPDPRFPFAAGRFVGSSGATSYGFGLSCAHTGSTGVYTFTLSPVAFGSATYDVEATSDQFSTAWTVTSNSVFVITTKTQAGTATDCTQLSVKVYHSP